MIIVGKVLQFVSVQYLVFGKITTNDATWDILKNIPIFVVMNHSLMRYEHFYIGVK